MKDERKVAPQMAVALISLRQVLPDGAREIWILVRGGCALIDQAALFEFAKRQVTRGDGVTFIGHFVGFAFNEHPPIPWRALVDGTLSANVRRAVTCDSVVPTWMIPERVDRIDVFQKPRARLRR